MTRVGVLRVGYAAFGIAFAALAASAFAGALLVPALVCALAAALILLFSDDELPRWSGVVLVGYFLLIAVAFLLSNGITIRKGGAYGIEPPNPDLANNVLYYLGLASPLMLGLTAAAAAWERENAARLLLLGGAGGFVVVAVLTVVLAPSATDASAIAQAQSQGNLLQLLFALSAVAAAAGAAWSATRPEELS